MGKHLLLSRDSIFYSTSNLECISRPELLAIHIIAKHNHFTWNLFKVITNHHASFPTFLTVILIYFNQLLQGPLSNRYLEKYLIVRNYVFCPSSCKTTQQHVPFCPEAFQWFGILVSMEQASGLNCKYHRQQQLPASSLGHLSLIIDLQQQLLNWKVIVITRKKLWELWIMNTKTKLYIKNDILTKKMTSKIKNKIVG